MTDAFVTMCPICSNQFEICDLTLHHGLLNISRIYLLQATLQHPHAATQLI